MEDVVLPLAGHKVRLPEWGGSGSGSGSGSSSGSGNYHRSFMEADGLAEAQQRGDGRAAQFAGVGSECVLKGTYRKVVVKPRHLSWHWGALGDDPASEVAAPVVEEEQGCASIRFTLPPGAYATMCLRELLRQEVTL